MPDTRNQTIERYDELLALMDGDRELLQELIDVFLVDAPERIECVKRALDNRDAGALYQAAHALKGSAGNFGARAVVGRAVTLEALARNGDLDAALVEFECLKTEMTRLTSDLAAARNAP